jgi:23S rRNA (cytidine1920-2'-O)/16S rRNA (cytidine1409-2'-O)-methyltransferase
MRALDVGASTGGFTACLLAHGAEHVVALDVGYGQLAYTLRIDPRVTVVERCNFRIVPDDAFGRDFDLVTFDASFVSVIPLIARAASFLKQGAQMVALIKPQFEAGRERVRAGVVRDPAVHREVLVTVRAQVLELGLVPIALMRSPLRGPAGNVEFFVRIVEAGEPFDDRALDETLGAE